MISVNAIKWKERPPLRFGTTYNHFTLFYLNPLCFIQLFPPKIMHIFILYNLCREHPRFREYVTHLFSVGKRKGSNLQNSSKQNCIEQRKICHLFGTRRKSLSTQHRQVTTLMRFVKLRSKIFRLAEMSWIDLTAILNKS